MTEKSTFLKKILREYSTGREAIENIVIFIDENDILADELNAAIEADDQELRDFIEQKNLTLKAAASFFDVNERTIGRWKSPTQHGSGKKISPRASRTILGITDDAWWQLINACKDFDSSLNKEQLADSEEKIMISSMMDEELKGAELLKKILFSFNEKAKEDNDADRVILTDTSGRIWVANTEFSKENDDTSVAEDDVVEKIVQYFHEKRSSYLVNGNGNIEINSSGHDFYKWRRDPQEFKVKNELYLFSVRNVLDSEDKNTDFYVVIISGNKQTGILWNLAGSAIIKSVRDQFKI